MRIRSFCTLLSLLLLWPAASATASSFQIWEDSAGAPGVSALFPTGSGLLADIDFDADAAEGGALLFGASEIEMIPLGDVVFVDFTCELAGCTENVDYVFTPGGEGVGLIRVSDPNFDSPIHGIFDLGSILFDAAGLGQIRLTGCNYTDANAVERTCDPFTLVNVPEPGTGALLGGSLAAVALLRRRRR